MTEQPDAPDSTTISDRRRPGRVAYANPHLIALLRRSPREAPLPHGSEADLTGSEQEEARADDLQSARGLAVSVALGVVFWAAVIWTAIRLIGR